jgi:hypothetical protein
MTKGATARSTWKLLEKRLANTLGVGRNSSKEMGLAAPDIIALVQFKKSALLDIEVKLCGQPPGYMEKVLKQATDNCKGGSHIPIGIMKPKHVADDNAIVFMHWSEFKKFLILEDGDE